MCLTAFIIPAIGISSLILETAEKLSKDRHSSDPITMEAQYLEPARQWVNRTVIGFVAIKTDKGLVLVRTR